MLLPEKRVGDFFALSPSRSATLVSVRHDDEWGEPLQRARLLQYRFIVQLRVQRRGRQHDHLWALRFGFGRDTTSEKTWQEAGTRYALSVARLQLPEPQSEHDSLRVTLRLQTTTGPSGHAATGLGAPSSSSSSSSDASSTTTTTTDTTDSERDSDSDDEDEESSSEVSLSSSDTPVRKRILVLGVAHDETEALLVRHMTSVLNHARRAGHPGVQRLCVFWEPTKAVMQHARLRPQSAFEAARFSLPIEAQLYGDLQFVLSAYLLYILPRDDTRLRPLIMVWHGIDEDEARQLARYYGAEDGAAIDIVVRQCIDWLRLTMTLGRTDALAAFQFMFGNNETLTAQFLGDMAKLVQRVIMIEPDRLALEQARRDFEAATQDGDEWYYNSFFINYVHVRPVEDTNYKRIRRHAHQLRRLLMGLVRLLIRGPDNEADLVALSRADYESPVPVDALRDDEERLLALLEVREWCEGEGWALDERYFAALGRQVYAQYGHIGSSLMILLEAAVARRRSARRMGDLVQEYRDVQSALHTVHTLETLGNDCTQAVLVVGTAHVAPLVALLSQVPGYAVQRYMVNSGISGLDTTLDLKRSAARAWEPRLRAYLTLEALDQWSIELGGGIHMLAAAAGQARLQLYLFLAYADELNPRHFDPLVARDRRLLAQLLRMHWMLWQAVWPYHDEAGPPPELRQAASADAARAMLQRLRYAPPLVEALVQLRALWPQPADVTREPGHGFSGAQIEHFNATRGEWRIDDLQSDWGASMPQADWHAEAVRGGGVNDQHNDAEEDEKRPVRWEFY